MSRNTLGLAVLLGLALAAFLGSRGGFFGREDPLSATSMARAAAEANKGLPRKIDEITEATRVEGQRGTLIYHYTLTRGSASDYDSAAALAQIRPPTVNAALD